MSVCPEVPLVVLPGKLHPVLPWKVSDETQIFALRAARAMNRVCLLARDPNRQRFLSGLPDAIGALDKLANTLGDYGEPLDPATLPVGKEIHQYFGVRHSDSMSTSNTLLYAVTIARWCLLDLRYAAFEGNDVLSELQAINAIIHGITDVKSSDQMASYNERNTRLLDWTPDGGAWHRWMVAHHLYLLLNLYASKYILIGANLAAEEKWDKATRWLTTGVTHTRGFTAAMLHSAVLPGNWYQGTIRPTMRPPYVSAPLTGNAFTEHHAYRRALNALMNVAGPWDALSATQPAFAEARAAVLAADLQDTLAHARMSYTLVGADQSLVQTDPDATAVGELMDMYLRRAEVYRKLLRPGMVHG